MNCLKNIAESYRGSANMQEALLNFKIEMPGTVMSNALLFKHATNMKKKDKAGISKMDMLQKITHLSLENKKIT